MALQKVTRPKSRAALLQRAKLGDTVADNQAHQTTTAGIAALEARVSTLETDLTQGMRPTITGSKGGNAALASLITTLAALGIVKDGTT